MGCDAYRLRHKPKQEAGKPPTVPVAYIQIPQECSGKELFAAIIEHLKYQMTKGTVAEIRDRTHIPHPNCHTSTKSRFSSIYELKYKREKVQLMRRNSIKLRMGQEGEVLETKRKLHR